MTPTMCASSPIFAPSAFGPCHISNREVKQTLRIDEEPRFGEQTLWVG